MSILVPLKVMLSLRVAANTTVTLHYDKAFKIAVVAIYPARLNSVSSKRKTQLARTRSFNFAYKKQAD